MISGCSLWIDPERNSLINIFLCLVRIDHIRTCSFVLVYSNSLLVRLRVVELQHLVDHLFLWWQQIYGDAANVRSTELQQPISEAPAIHCKTMYQPTISAQLFWLKCSSGLGARIVIVTIKYFGVAGLVIEELYYYKYCSSRVERQMFLLSR